jgi:putative ATPase
MAVEDIGLADPQAQRHLPRRLGDLRAARQPRGRTGAGAGGALPRARAEIERAYVAYKAARASAKKTGSEPPPKHILNAPTKLMKEQGYGAGYAYDHDAEDGFSGQNYFPDGMKRAHFYQPVERGFERDLKKAAGVVRDGHIGRVHHLLRLFA